MVAQADGSTHRVLIERFIPDADLETARREWGEWLERWPEHDWLAGRLDGAGPAELTWSPAGDKIAFLAADAHAPMGWPQAWVYDFVTRRLIKVTSEHNLDASLNWS